MLGCAVLDSMAFFFDPTNLQRSLGLHFYGSDFCASGGSYLKVPRPALVGEPTIPFDMAGDLKFFGSVLDPWPQRFEN